ncbi:hypothetical protein KEM52_000911, partial [Ascosphaera acerosa]
MEPPDQSPSIAIGSTSTMAAARSAPPKPSPPSQPIPIAVPTSAPAPTSTPAPAGMPAPAPAPAHSPDSWLGPLNRKIDLMAVDTLEGNFRRALAVTLRDLLLRKVTPAQAAAHIDAYCTSDVVSVLPARPNRVGGVFTFRSTVDRAICHISTVVCWQGDKQDLLVQLLLELRRLP